MAVTSTAWGVAAVGEEDVAEAAGVAGLLGVAVPRVLVGEATAGELLPAPRDEEVAEAAGVVGLAGASAGTLVVGEATTGEAGAAPLEGAAVACPNIFDMRLVNIPITPKDTPRRDRKPVQPLYFLQFTGRYRCRMWRSLVSFVKHNRGKKRAALVEREAVSCHKREARRP
jgi:hypothetical protein